MWVGDGFVRGEDLAMSMDFPVLLREDYPVAEDRDEAVAREQPVQLGIWHGMPDRGKVGG